MRRLVRALRAARHYRPEQVIARAWIVARRRAATLAPRALRTELDRIAAAPPTARAAAIHPGFRHHLLAEAVTPAARADDLLAGRFAFLGTARDLGEPPDWGSTRAPRPAHLWRMNLHYHRFVVDAAAAAARAPAGAARVLERASALLDGWSAACRPADPGSWADAWNSYSASTRVLHARLARLLAGTVAGGAARAFERRLDARAAVDAAFVERWLEWDLGGNHLLRNACALVAAGAWFEGPRARRWRDGGAAILRRELHAQVLPDGLLEERSAMYHAVLLEDLLTAGCAGAGPGATAGWLLPELGRLARALRSMLHPDGEIALFNDAAFGVASPAASLLDLAAACGVAGPAGPAGDLPSAGYFRSGTGGEALIVDAGALGPDHLPAHAHCDALSFEWSLDGERIVVDTGVDRYEAGPERDFQRSTAAHSTLRAGGREQGEPFGSFRMGRRPRVEGARTADGGVRGAHDGFGPEAIHERTIHHPGPACLIWTDRVLGDEQLPVEVRLGLAPGADAALAGDRVVIRTPRGTRLGLDLPAGGAARLEPGVSCQGFGAARPRPVVVWRGHGGRGRPHRFELRRAP